MGTTMSWMFSSALSFNADVSSWDVSQVTDMQGMFANYESWCSHSAFNQTLCWDIQGVKTDDMFFESSGSIDESCASNDAAVTNDDGNDDDDDGPDDGSLHVISSAVGDYWSITKDLI